MLGECRGDSWQLCQGCFSRVPAWTLEFEGNFIRKGIWGGHTRQREHCEQRHTGVAYKCVNVFPPSPLVTKSRGQENMLYFSKLLIMDISRHTQKKREWYIEPLCMTWRYDAGTFSIAGKCRLDICIIQVATVGDS